MLWPQDCRSTLTFHLMPNDSIDTNPNTVIITDDNVALQPVGVVKFSPMIVLTSNLIINTHGTDASVAVNGRT